jgi:hypothetical protein
MTTNTQKLELSADTVLVKLYGGVTGITRRTNREDEHRDGKAVETTREVTTRQADAAEATRAKKLLNQLRSTVDKYCTSIINLTVASAHDLPRLRAEVAPIQAEIDTHNRTARFHKIDRALIMAPIALHADAAALTEVCRQICDELKTARAFFDLEILATVANTPEPLKAWLVSVDNWITRTAGLGSLFPTVTGQCIGEGIASVKELRVKVAKLTRANENAGQSPESALRGAIQTVTSVDGALGLLDSAIGLTAITDSEAKADSDALRTEGGGVDLPASAEVH